MSGVGCALLATLVLWFSPGTAVSSHLVDPSTLSQHSWEVGPSGFVIVGYDTDNNGKADLFALHYLHTSFFSSRGLAEEKGNFPQHILFTVDYDHDHFFYVAHSGATLYALDVNEDGIWDIMYSDAGMDGVNGNEKFYDSPSGMFSGCPGDCVAGK